MTEVFIFSGLTVFLIFYLFVVYFRCQKREQRYLRIEEKANSQIFRLEKMASLGTLSAGVAHEINNPLTFLITNLSLIADNAERLRRIGNVNEQDEAIAQMKESIQECLDGANRIKRIVQDLLVFSHASAERTKLADINEVIDSTLRIVWNELKYKADITKDYKAQTRIWLDTNKISQVLLNLIVNASDAIKAKTAQDKGLISLATKEEGDFIIIDVSDNGCGMDKSLLQRIFDPFFTNKGGTGLGLYVSKKIILSHGGQLSVASTPGKGTAFTIKLPKDKNKT